MALMSTVFALSTGLFGHYQTDSTRIMISFLLFMAHGTVGVYVLWKMNIFKYCYNKYKSLRCDETGEMVENVPLNLSDSELN